MWQFVILRNMFGYRLVIRQRVHWWWLTGKELHLVQDFIWFLLLSIENKTYYITVLQLTSF